MKVFSKDINDKKEFDRIGIHYKQVLADDEHHVYLYEMENQHYPSYELVKGKKHTNPDGRVVYTYPSDEDFGVYGWYYCGRPEIVEKKIVEKWLELTGGVPDFSIYR